MLGLMLWVLQAGAAVASQPSQPPRPGPATEQQQQVPFAGRWQGPVIGADFIFEFSMDGANLAGRYRSTRSTGWLPLLDVVAVGNRISFRFESQPPSNFDLTLDPTQRTLKGQAQFGANPPLPLSLTRAS